MLAPIIKSFLLSNNSLFLTSLKKIASILLLGIFGFNLGGYHILTGYLENRAEQQLQASLDQDEYNTSDLFSIKVPASLPYGTSSEKFDRVEGSIEIKGVTYTYVKRRFYRDSLELICIANTARNSIRNARMEFARLANDIVSNNTSKKAPSGQSHPAKFKVQDFTDEQYFFSWQFRDADPAVNRHPGFNAGLVSGHLRQLEKPPQA